MSTNARWIIGLLIALVVGLAVALLIVAGDDADDGPTTLPTLTQDTETQQTETLTPTVTETTVTEPTTDGSGGVAAP